MKRTIFFAVTIFFSIVAMAFAQMSPEETAYREMGCQRVGTNETGGGSFQCCGICPTLEILSAYDPSWDVPDSTITPSCVTVPAECPTCAECPICEECPTCGECPTCPACEECPTCPACPGDVIPTFATIQVKDYAAITSTSTHSWQLNDPWMELVPNSGARFDLTDGPMLSYQVNIDAGTYYIWILGQGPDASSDSVHYGLNGTKIGSITFLNSNWSNEIQADGSHAMLTVTTPGENTLNLWGREDGTSIQTVVLTQDPAYHP